MFTESKVTKVHEIPTKAGLQAIQEGKQIGTTHSWIQIEYNDGKMFKYTADSTMTGFDPTGGWEKNGKICYCIFDHSGTAVGYYATKKDYLALENVIRQNGHDYVADSFGHDGNCEIYIDQSEVKHITVRN